MTATCRRSAGERSEAGAVDLQPRTSGYVVETDCGRPPPTGTTAIRGKHSTVPCVFAPGLHGLPALSGVLTPPCVTVRPGMSAFSRDLYFWTGRTNPPSAQIRGRGPELPLNRHGHVLSSVCLALTPSRRPGVLIARRWPILPPGGAPPAHAWGPTSPYGLLFCMSQSHVIRAKGYLF